MYVFIDLMVLCYATFMRHFVRRSKIIKNNKLQEIEKIGMSHKCVENEVKMGVF